MDLKQVGNNKYYIRTGTYIRVRFAMDYTHELCLVAFARVNPAAFDLDLGGIYKPETQDKLDKARELWAKHEEIWKKHEGRTRRRKYLCFSSCQTLL